MPESTERPSLAACIDYKEFALWQLASYAESDIEVCDSHIIPASAHRATKNKGHNFLISTHGPPQQNDSDMKEPMLCSCCEKKFGDFENRWAPVSRKLYEELGSKSRMRIPTEDLGAMIGAVQSIFWRASVSEKMCADYKLPPETEAQLRLNMQAEPPILHLGCSVSIFSIEEVRSPFIVSPIRNDHGESQFGAFGLVFRMFDTGQPRDLPPGEILDSNKGIGFAQHGNDGQVRLVRSFLESAQPDSDALERALGEFHGGQG
ncbi:hypothetical protein IGB42_01797 [Andreprevotia sp. IGB-42]|uniref:hypothetical protein n=1 Tax=Andreprevotia sp. IGB-42 TaxID=2497473 RepID=UPI00135BC8BF|nr:hypothetical protein [Andreprevotia sp. IGB-42]KAF0813446.1 hypothetical protein IGB42_01797 [Andreprevotia sp. IGB-42]